MNTEVIYLKRSQIDKASEILATAFDNDPIFHYISPKAGRKREEIIKTICKASLHYSQSYQHVYTTTEDMKGVAVWIPPRHFPLNLFRLLQSGLYKLPFQIGLSGLKRVMPLFKMEEYHKQDMPQPHWYLSLLGVAPAYQGQGIGSFLLQPILNQADDEGTPCYLETSTEAAVRFYQKHGFEVARKSEFQNSSPPFWTMKRVPCN